MKKEKQHRSTSRSMITTPQEYTGEHPRPVSSLLKGLIRRKNNEKTNLSNAAMENKLASLFSIAALLKLVFSLFFRLMSPLSKDETGRGCSPVYSCGVVIMDLLVDRCCFSFSNNTNLIKKEKRERDYQPL